MISTLRVVGAAAVEVMCTRTVNGNACSGASVAIKVRVAGENDSHDGKLWPVGRVARTASPEPSVAAVSKASLGSTKVKLLLPPTEARTATPEPLPWPRPAMVIAIVTGLTPVPPDEAVAPEEPDELVPLVPPEDELMTSCFLEEEPLLEPLDEFPLLGRPLNVVVPGPEEPLVPLDPRLSEDNELVVTFRMVPEPEEDDPEEPLPEPEEDDPDELTPSSRPISVPR